MQALVQLQPLSSQNQIATLKTLVTDGERLQLPRFVCSDVDKPSTPTGLAFQSVTFEQRLLR